MKLLWIATLFCLVNLTSCAAPLNYMKFTRVQCSASGKTCDNLWCNVKPVARNNSLLNLNCDLKRELKKFYISITSWHKALTERNFRQIIKVDNVEVCGVLENIEKFPMFKDYVDALLMCFPGIVQKCPFKGKLKVMNGTFALEGAQKEILEKSPFRFYPNGIIKASLEFKDDLDEKILEFTYFHENNFRNNKLNGNKF